MRIIVRQQQNLLAIGKQAQRLRLYYISPLREIHNQTILAEASFPCRFLPRSATFRNSPWLVAANHRQVATCLFSSTPSIGDDASNVKRYLCHQQFPLGSLDTTITQEIVASMESCLEQGSAENVTLAVQLLNRLAEESSLEGNESFVNNNSKQLESLSELPPKIVDAWQLQWKARQTRLTPNQVFEIVKSFEMGFAPTLSFHQAQYRPLVESALESGDPALAEAILDHVLKGSSPDSSNNDSINNDITDFANVVTFTKVMHAWTTSGRDDAPLRAEAVLEKMKNYGTAGWTQADPDVVAYNAAITAWARVSSTDDKAPHRAEELFREMQSRALQPNLSSISMVLTAWAHSKEVQGADRANDILMGMVDTYQGGGSDSLKPTPYFYATVITAYANRGETLRAEQILLDQCELCLSTRDRDFLPTQKAFLAVIDSFSRSGRPDWQQSAEALLSRMHEMAVTLEESRLLPDAFCFNSVLRGWAYSNDKQAPHHCEMFLQKMQHLHEQGLADCKPNLASFSAVLHCWAKSTRSDAPERAESILRHLQSLHQAGQNDYKPDTALYNTVMHAWSRSSHPDAAWRAQMLFDELRRRHEGGDRALKPDKYSYGTLIFAWGQSRHKGNAARAQEIFDDLIARARNGDATLQPDVVHFNSLIDTWAKAGNPQKAEQILDMMKSGGIAGVQPDASSFNVTMNAWSRCHDPDAAERTQKLFDDLLELYKAGDIKMKPNLRVVSTLIATWGRKRTQEGAAKAQTLFDDLLFLYRSGHKDLKPDAVIYTALMDAWAKAGLPEKAEQILHEMDSLGVKPDLRTYHVVMNGWAHSRSPNSSDRMQAVYNELNGKYLAGNEALKPDVRMLDVVLSTWLHRNTGEGGMAAANKVFDQALARYKSGEGDLKPLLDRYSALVGASTTAS